jgi:hypothetical protein
LITTATSGPGPHELTRATVRASMVTTPRAGVLELVVVPFCRLERERLAGGSSGRLIVEAVGLRGELTARRG